MFKNYNSFFLFFYDIIFILPSRKRLTLGWNFGSMLGFVLGFQLLTGTFLAFYFTADSGMAFLTVQYLMYEINFGWIFRIFHFNGASLFFVFLYLHIFKGLFIFSYRLKHVWMSGLTLYLLLIIEAFMGYVLVWAQISFWAAVVITSLLSVVPFWGTTLVIWVWRGFGVTGATLKFFFVIHFLLPWALILLVFGHLVFLHSSGRTSILYCHGDFDKISFFPSYWVKDFYNFFFFFIFFFLSLILPFFLGDHEIFIEADPMMSPIHIVPEWYFLFAYAILRAIPNKILGVIALLISIVSFYFLGLINNFLPVIFKLNKLFVFFFVFVSIFLSWLGQCLVEYPFSLLRPIFSFIYFFNVYLILLSFYFFKVLFSFVFIIINILNLEFKD